MEREEILRHPAYWHQGLQLDLYRAVQSYMDSEGLNKTELSERLNISKRCISQTLNGDFNYSLKTLVNLSLAIGFIPNITYTKVEEVIKMDNQKRLSKATLIK